MINFLEETETYMFKLGYFWSDVSFISGKEFSISVENFREVAANADYDPGYGAPEVAEDLVIVFNDGCWFDRREYDGSEWWAYNQVPQKPDSERKIHALVVEQKQNDEFSGWLTLEQMNRID